MIYIHLRKFSHVYIHMYVYVDIRIHIHILHDPIHTSVIPRVLVYDKVCTCHSMRCLDIGIHSIRTAPPFKARSRNHQKRSKLVDFPAPLFGSMGEKYHFQVVCVIFRCPRNRPKPRGSEVISDVEIH